MTKALILPIVPGIIPERRFAENGDIPSQSALRRVAWQYNRVSTKSKRLLFMKANETQATPAPAASSQIDLKFGFRTGENVSRIGVLAGLAPASATDGSNQAAISLYIDDGTSHKHKWMYYPKVKAGVYDPGEVAWMWSQSDNGVAPNTLYDAYIQQESFARIHCISVYEIASPIADSSIDGICDPTNWEANKPILDANVQELAETGTLLYKHNGAMLVSWSRHTTATAPTVTSTTYVNMLKTSLSSNTDASPGFMINTEFHNSYQNATADTTVPVEISVLAVRTSAGSGTASLRLLANPGQIAEVTGITSGSRFTVPRDLIVRAENTGKTDIQVKVPSGETWRFDSVSMWEYEA